MGKGSTLWPNAGKVATDLPWLLRGRVVPGAVLQQQNEDDDEQARVDQPTIRAEDGHGAAEAGPSRGLAVMHAMEIPLLLVAHQGFVVDIRRRPELAVVIGLVDVVVVVPHWFHHVKKWVW